MYKLQILRGEEKRKMSVQMISTLRSEVMSVLKPFCDHVKVRAQKDMWNLPTTEEGFPSPTETLTNLTSKFILDTTDT